MSVFEVFFSVKETWYTWSGFLFVFYKRYKFCGYLFAFLKPSLFWKEVYSNTQNEDNLMPRWMDSFSEEGQLKTIRFPLILDTIVGLTTF